MPVVPPSQLCSGASFAENRSLGDTVKSCANDGSVGDRDGGGGVRMTTKLSERDRMTEPPLLTDIFSLFFLLLCTLSFTVSGG